MSSADDGAEERRHAREKREKDEADEAERRRIERQREREREEEAKKNEEQERKNKEREEREKRRRDQERKEREEEEKSRREREERVREREKASATPSSSSSSSSSGSFKPCKSDLVDDDKSSISEAEMDWILKCVNQSLKGSKQFSSGFRSVDALVTAFRDGILPCVHLGALCPKDIDVRAVNSRVDDNMDREENFTLYLGSARGVGASFDRSISKSSLCKPTKEIVFACLWQSMKCGINIAWTREASIRRDLASESRASEGEIRDEWPANKIMFTWVNMVLQKRAKSFADLPDLLPQLTKHCLGKSCASIEECERLASRADIPTIADALASGHGRVTYAFVGNLFEKFIK